MRATHIPTRISVFVSHGRSQLQNKKEAKRRILGKLEEKQLLLAKERIHEEWGNHLQLERGNPIRVFKGSDFNPHIKTKSIDLVEEAKNRECSIR